MAQRTLIFQYNVPHGFNEVSYKRDLRFIASDITELYGDIDFINKTLNNLVSIAVTNPLNFNEIFVGDVTNNAVSVPMSGDATIVASGAVTVTGLLGNAIPADAVGALTNDGAGNLTWTPAAVGGITTLNTLVAAVQTFSKVDDTNMSLTITSAAANHDFTLAWVGTLADARIASAATWNAKQAPITLTTIGTSGAATFIANTLNIPDYTATAPALTQNEIAFGDAVNLMTSSSNLTWIEASRNFTITGTIGLTVSNSANVFYAAQGTVGFWFTGTASTGLLSHQGFGIDFDAGKNLYTVGDVGITNNTHIEVDDVAQTIELTSVNPITASNLAGVGVRMVTASAAGVLSTAVIPGGMTNPMTTLGDIIYEDAVPAPNRLAGNITVNRQFLSQTGTGAVSAAPIWVRIDAGDIASGVLPANFGGTGISNNAASTLTISGAFATTLTVTGATNVTLPTTGTLATQAYADALTRSYCLSGATLAAASSPGDNQTYFFGSRVSIITTSTTSSLPKIYFPQAGTIIAVRVTFSQNASSAETSSLYLRLNNTTDITISTTVTNDAVTTTFIATGLSQAVNATTDYVEFKWNTPLIWITNPTFVAARWDILVKPN